MPQPFNYIFGGQTSPTQNLTQALNLAKGISGLKAQREEAQRTAKTQRQFQADIAALGAEPAPRDVANLMVKYPSMSENFKRGFDALSSEQQRSRVDQASRVYAALEGGNTEVAAELLGRYADAYRNTGDERNAKAAEDFARLVELNPAGAKTTAGLMLASTMGPEKFTETFTGLQEERREAELQPGALEKQAADLGLDKAKTAKALAETKKLGAEIQKLALELEAAKDETGAVPPEDRFKAEKDLRDEYFKRTKDFTAVQEAHRRIQAADESAAGDLSLIFSYMKMLDPGSTVREGEFASAQNAAGVDEKVLNLYNNILTGERLNPTQRKMFKKQAEGLLGAARKREEEVRKGLSGVVERGGLNPDNVFIIQEEAVEVPAADEQPQQPSYMRHAR